IECSCICVVYMVPPPTVSYTLSLHDALPICFRAPGCREVVPVVAPHRRGHPSVEGPAAGRSALGRGPTLGWVGSDVVGSDAGGGDRKSTRLNSSHVKISYAVFCLKKTISHRG